LSGPFRNPDAENASQTSFQSEFNQAWVFWGDARLSENRSLDVLQAMQPWPEKNVQKTNNPLIDNPDYRGMLKLSIENDSQLHLPQPANRQPTVDPA